MKLARRTRTADLSVGYYPTRAILSAHTTPAAFILLTAAVVILGHDAPLSFWRPRRLACSLTDTPEGV